MVGKFVTGIDNDGLTRQEREEYAGAYRATMLGPLNPTEGEAVRRWLAERWERG